jgi:hypothetical protein
VNLLHQAVSVEIDEHLVSPLEVQRPSACTHYGQVAM